LAKVKNVRTAILILVVLFIAGCSQDQAVNSSKAEQEESVDVNEQLNVELILPEKAKVGESIEIKALVTQGNEAVDDAHEVVFEIWKEEEKDHSEMMDYTEYEEGYYSIKISLDEPGVYHIQPHVTARGMHIMPVKQVVIEEE
jgi:YtkA-like